MQGEVDLSGEVRSGGELARLGGYEAGGEQAALAQAEQRAAGGQVELHHVVAGVAFRFAEDPGPGPDAEAAAEIEPAGEGPARDVVHPVALMGDKEPSRHGPGPRAGQAHDGAGGGTRNRGGGEYRGIQRPFGHGVLAAGPPGLSPRLHSF